MRRRGIGMGAIKNKNLAQARFKDKGSELAEDQLNQMSKQLDVFRTHLEDFAAKHKDDIRKDPQFRKHFQEMCATIGVDPLASGKGFWAEMLGVGDFYYELGVQIVEVCLATSHRNGGLMDLEELRQKLLSTRGKRKQEISIDDLMRAIKKLKVLGNGFTVIPVGGRYLVQSVPGELSMDHTAVLQLAEDTGYVSMSMIRDRLKWGEERSHRAVDYMLKEGLAWVDDQAPQEKHFWFPALFSNLDQE
ncbi:vacuolar-sorting protein SNF8 [Lingula anatina]|uniref:Vacuolar-sorting protein SNF8 n=1 Tax=Lingula anatina TaxID=7574 RepID=A0A1S3IXU7_LINAN|nr:vacuolar-sorting protein SNF8 [Lingula anatina]|eukprot:XP_013403020.1 vacuolar-sorting protein SNF8 [Lingula anatina]